MASVPAGFGEHLNH